MRVRTGLERLMEEYPHLLQDARVGLVAHPAAVLPDLTSALAALYRCGARVTALFGPEHGFRGAAADGAQIGHALEARHGLPVFSLYGETKEPTAEMLSQVDVLVFDMQDVGVRFYTFLSTLYYVLSGAARENKPVIVLDRPNPIGGQVLEGPGIVPGYESFIGVIPIPIRHAMTFGELATYMNSECSLNANLTVVEMQGWQRSQWFDQTGLPWVPTSPAMPHLSTATLYPGMCFLEGTDLSLGRGTALPFEICGAPWVDGDLLAERLNALELRGVRFRAASFTPTDAPWTRETCHGVQAHVTDRESLRPVTVGLHLCATLRALWPDHFQWRNPIYGRQHFDLLLGGPDTRQALEEGQPIETIVESWEKSLAQFIRTRQKYLRYA